MLQNPADEVVRHLGQPETLGVGIVYQDVLPRLGVGYVEVDVAGAAGLVCEGFGHVGGDCSMLSGHLTGHHLEEGVTVGGGEGVGIIEVDLVLAAAVFVVGLVYPPPEAVQAVGHFLQIAEDPGNALVVVTGLFEVVDVIRVEDRNLAVLFAVYEKVLGFNADVKYETLVPQLSQHLLHVLPGAVGMRLAVYEQVRSEACGLGVPGEGSVGVDVDTGGHVVGVGPLAHAVERTPGEARAIVDNVVKRGSWDELDLGGPMNVDELGQDVLDPVPGHLLPYLLSVGHALLRLRL